MKTLLIILILLSTQAYSLTKTEIENSVNKFLCSDNPVEMAAMIEYPVLFASGYRLFNEDEFYHAVSQSSKEFGLYKLGKSCVGFTWKIRSILDHLDSSYTIKAYPSNNHDIKVLVYISKTGLIIGAIEDFE